MPDGMFISIYVVFALGISNAIMTNIFAVIIYLLLQHPLENATGYIVQKYISQQKVMEMHYALTKETMDIAGDWALFKQSVIHSSLIRMSLVSNKSKKDDELNA